MRSGLALCLLAFMAPPHLAAQAPQWQSLVIHPAKIRLDGPRSEQQILVTARDATGRLRDVTRQSRWESAQPVVRIDADGLATPLTDGTIELRVQAAGLSATVPVQVAGMASDLPVDFAREARPILTKAGCNQGACHGGQHGKGGFRLSLLGFDSAFDYTQIVQSAEGRRVLLSEPERSMLLLKPSLRMEHGGGERLPANSTMYATLLRWLEDGAPEPPSAEAVVTRLDVYPPHRICEPGDQQQLQVRATWNDGKSQDVTRLAQYDALGEAVAQVTPTGLVTAKGRGETYIMIRFCGQVSVAQVTLPFATKVASGSFTPAGFIDEKLQAKWRDLGLLPSPLASDSDFFRRLHLDAIGTLPTAEDVKAFLADADPKKRAKAIEKVLDRPELVDFWTLKWGDLLRINRDQLQEKGMWSFHNWLRAALRDGKPMDELAREIVTAEGSTFTNGPANFYRLASTPADWAETTTQLFLGVRIQCARCHHHPFEKWSQDDYYGMAAFFARMGTKNSQEFGIFGRETVVHLRPAGEQTHPRKGGVVKPHPLDGPDMDDAFDRRRKLAEWMTAKENPYFARNLVNRFWGYFMGHGLVEPLDDLRATNPATNEPLLAALAEDFATHGFDLKHLMRTILSSRAYQLSSKAEAGNAADAQNLYHARYSVKRLSAEQLADALDQITQTKEKYQGLPLGTRAIQLPDTSVRSFLMDVFGRPPRQITCECERKAEPNIAQALHLLNGEALGRKLAAPSGRLETLLKAKAAPEAIVESLFLAVLSRPATPEESIKAAQWMKQAPSLREGTQDLMWVLVNSREFLFVH